MEVKLHEKSTKYKKYAVIITYEKGKLILVKHRNRKTWEIPGGHHEVGETIIETAKRELKEETGAKKFTIEYMCDYSVTAEGTKNYGGLFEAEILERESNLEHEISKVKQFKKLPPIHMMTHGTIQTKLFNLRKKINR